MEKNYSHARLSQDPLAKDLVDHLIQQEEALRVVDGVVYYDFPVFRDLDDVLYRSSLLFVSRSHGVLLFKTARLNARGDFQADLEERDQRLEQLDSLIFSKLIKSQVLRRTKRDLKVQLESYLFIDGVDRTDLNEERIENAVLTSLQAIDTVLEDHRLTTPLEAEVWEELSSILEGAKGLLRPKDRAIAPGDTSSRAAILAQLEQEVANFDRSQRKAAITIIEGPQRIRGLAGSGKTVVLAMKAAQIHLSNPAATVLYTFYTKSLYDFIRELITRFYRHFTESDPDFDRIQLRHGWGGRDVDGVYYDAAIENGVTPIPYKEALNHSRHPFDYVCTQLLAATPIKPKYDYVLMDEAQDFPPSFYQLCFALTRGGDHDRNVVWAYDELQNIMDVRLRTPRETFGVDSNDIALVDLDRASERFGENHDVVLHKCYRNPRETLICAHALGFGLYSTDNMVQMLESREHWEDVGYRVVRGNCVTGEETVIERPAQNSPLSISRLQERDDLVRTFVAENAADEVAWICGEIREFLAGGLRPDDIVVVALDDRNARFYFKKITQQLTEDGVPVNNLLLDPYSRPVFSKENRVTLSTVWRAKGNEAPVVFAIGIDAIHPTRRTQVGRNKIFTAFTRAKAWLRVSGIGENARYFMREIGQAMELAPRLVFTYPDMEELVVLQRDLNDQATRLNRLHQEIETQLDQLELTGEERERFFESVAKKG